MSHNNMYKLQKRSEEAWKITTGLPNILESRIRLLQIHYFEI